MDDQVGRINTVPAKKDSAVSFPCDLRELVHRTNEDRGFFAVNILINGPEREAGILGPAKLAFLIGAIDLNAFGFVMLFLCGDPVAIPAFDTIELGLAAAKTAIVYGKPP